jgi:hypothetical protein
MKKVPDNPEFECFTAAMQQILTVSKEELLRRMEAEKSEKLARKAASASRDSAVSSTSAAS